MARARVSPHAPATTTLGIDFDVVVGTGPVISTEINCEADVNADDAEIDIDASLPFIRKFLGTLSQEAERANTALSPFTLDAYTIEGKSSKNCLATNKLMMAKDGGDGTMHMFLDNLAHMISAYACHQSDCGAQVIQLFESFSLGKYRYSGGAKLDADGDILPSLSDETRQSKRHILSIDPKPSEALRSDESISPQSHHTLETVAYSIQMAAGSDETRDLTEPSSTPPPCDSHSLPMYLHGEGELGDGR